MQTSYPSIVRRYLSTFIDMWIVIGVYFVSFIALQGSDNFISTVRFIAPTLFLILYEPVLTSRFYTIGQLITGIRVRNDHDLKRISIIKAYIRSFIKIFLGFISFFSIIFSDKSKAVHDSAATSIVIDAKSLEGGV